jgi:FkbM family methyltransferase
MVEIISYNKVNPEYDLAVIRTVPTEYANIIPDFAGATVLDIGGNIGCFSALALNKGAKKVITIEPGLPAFSHAEINLSEAIADGSCILYHAGITGLPDTKEVTLRYFQDAASMPSAQVIAPDDRRREHWRGRPYYYETVPAMYFPDVIEGYKPTVLKLDCEGSEYNCIKGIDNLPYVQTLAVEWHQTTKEAGITNYLICTEKLRSWGFKPNKEPNLVIYRYKDGRPFSSNQFFIRAIIWRR